MQSLYMYGRQVCLAETKSEATRTTAGQTCKVVQAQPARPVACKRRSAYFKCKTGNTYNQPNRPSSDTLRRPSTKHYRKGSPGVTTPTTTAAVHASAHQQQPAIITLTQQGHHHILSANEACCSKAQEQYTGGLSWSTPQTPPTSARTHSAPPPSPGGAIIRSGRRPAQGAPPASGEGKWGGGGVGLFVFV